MQRRRHREGEWRCGCAHYRGGNDATGLAFYKLLDGSFPLRPTQLWMPENDKKKKKKNGGQLSAFRSHSLLLSHIQSPLTRVTDGCLTPVEQGHPPTFFSSSSFHSLICWFIYERSRVRGSYCFYYIWFRFPVQHLYCVLDVRANTFFFLLKSKAFFFVCLRASVRTSSAGFLAESHASHSCQWR